MSDPTVDQDQFDNRNVLTNIHDSEPRGYVCPRTIVTPAIDGAIDESIWGHAPWTAEFVDIEGESRPRPTYRTRARMLWDDDFLYVAAELEDPHVWATLSDHDSVIYFDNDFEVFIDPSWTGHHYGELEINALGTTWDLMLDRPYRAGGKAYSGWEMHGTRTAVRIEGTLNNSTDTDVGWSVEIAIPWTALAEIADRTCPPANGDQWRVNFSRVHWDVEIVGGTYQKIPDREEHNWVWSPQSAIDMHRPEHWGIVQFCDDTADLPQIRPMSGWSNRLRLVRFWEAQDCFRRQHGRFSESVSALGLGADFEEIKLEATSQQFYAVLGSQSIDHQLCFGER